MIFYTLRKYCQFASYGTSEIKRYGMRVSYDRLWKLLIDKKMKRTDLITQAQISSNVVAKMGKEEPLSMESIGKICALFHCSVDDILEIIPDDETSE